MNIGNPYFNYSTLGTLHHIKKIEKTKSLAAESNYTM